MGAAAREHARGWTIENRYRDWEAAYGKVLA
jgi:hypothetical protein